VSLELSYHPSQGAPGMGIQFLAGQQWGAAFALPPTLRDEGAGALRQGDLPIGLALLVVGAYHLDCLAGQRMVRIGDVHAVAVLSR